MKAGRNYCECGNTKKVSVEACYRCRELERPGHLRLYLPGYGAPPATIHFPKDPFRGLLTIIKKKSPGESYRSLSKNTYRNSGRDDLLNLPDFEFSRDGLAVVEH